jgi:hypothetical protein
MEMKEFQASASKAQTIETEFVSSFALPQSLKKRGGFLASKA